MYGGCVMSAGSKGWPPVGWFHIYTWRISWTPTNRSCYGSQTFPVLLSNLSCCFSTYTSCLISYDLCFLLSSLKFSVISPDLFSICVCYLLYSCFLSSLHLYCDLWILFPCCWFRSPVADWVLLTPVCHCLIILWNLVGELQSSFVFFSVSCSLPIYVILKCSCQLLYHFGFFFIWFIAILNFFECGTIWIFSVYLWSIHFKCKYLSLALFL